ncbi:MAG: hypothetical protein ABI352_04015 [Candidatus Dormibacter sp.]
MATRGRGVAAVAVAVALAAAWLAAVPVSARADTAWWQPLAFAGQRVTSVIAGGGLVVVRTASGAFRSSDGGRSFTAIDGQHIALPLPPAATTWAIDNGVVVTASGGRPPAPDPRAPFLGEPAHLIAAPAALPGVVVAVGSDNHVWRRNASGQWATSFVLLPAGGLSGTPRVTSLAAFSTPLSVAVYMGTDGYGVLLSEDGGDDWIRADPGLPENVLGLDTDATAKALYAATDAGLYVHHLQSLPAPPVYVDASLYLRWLGIAVVALLATLAALLGLRRALPA